MRHWFLILMIVLLPVRSWSAGTMAGQMQTPHAATMAASTASSGPAAPEHAVTGLHKPAGMMPDCPDHASVQTPAPGTAASHHAPADPATSEATADCHSCTSCQICHSVAATVNAALPALTFSAHALPSSGGARFASAQPAQGLKPPIS